MEEIDNVFNNRTFMASGIYSFLDNLLTRVPQSSPTEATSTSVNSSNVNDQNIRPEERYSFHTVNPVLASALTEPDSFQIRRRRLAARLNNEHNQIRSPIPQSGQNAESDEASVLPDPSDVKVPLAAGGYLEEMFLYLSDKDKDELSCSVCYAILKETYQCKNEHRFCYGCIYTWATGQGVGHDCCPMCRCDGLYAKNDEIDERIKAKHVRCLKHNCNWLGFLNEYSEHLHRYYEPMEMGIFSRAVHEKQQRRKPVKLSTLPKRSIFNQSLQSNYGGLLHPAVLLQSPVGTLQSEEQVFNISSPEPLPIYPPSSSMFDSRVLHSASQTSNLENRDSVNFDLTATYIDDDSPLTNEHGNINDVYRRIINSHLLPNSRQNSSFLSLAEARILRRARNRPLRFLSRLSSETLSNENDQYTPNQYSYFSTTTCPRRRIGSINANELGVGSQPSAGLPSSRTHTIPSADPEFHLDLNIQQDTDHFNFLQRELQNGISTLETMDSSASVNDNLFQSTVPLCLPQINSSFNHVVSPRPRFNPINTQDTINEVTRAIEHGDTPNSSNRPELVYRRLVPVRPNQILNQLRETREQLTAMLNLMTTQLDSRRQNSFGEENGASPLSRAETNLDRVRARIRCRQTLLNRDANRAAANPIPSSTSVNTDLPVETSARFQHTRSFALQHLARLHRIELLLSEINDSPSENTDIEVFPTQIGMISQNRPILESTTPTEIRRRRRANLMHRSESNSESDGIPNQSTSTGTSSSNENDNLNEAIRNAMSIWSSDDELS